MPTGSPLASARACTSSSAVCGCSEPVGSCRRTRTAPSSGSIFARSTRVSISSAPPWLYTRPASKSLSAAMIASAASRRFETSLSGSWSRKTSIPFAAAEATKRREKSASTGREPTRKRPRSARPSGVLTRALSARIRSHGLSTPRLTAESKHPPPDTSRYAKPALSRISASRSCSATGTRPASGSCPSRRIVVSASDGTRGAYRATCGCLPHWRTA